MCGRSLSLSLMPFSPRAVRVMLLRRDLRKLQRLVNTYPARIARRRGAPHHDEISPAMSAMYQVQAMRCSEISSLRCALARELAADEGFVLGDHVRVKFQEPDPRAAEAVGALAGITGRVAAFVLTHEDIPVVVIETTDAHGRSYARHLRTCALEHV